MPRFRISDFGLWVAAALALHLAVACSSGSDGATPPKISSAVAERDIVDDRALLSTTIKLTFDRDWELADTNLPFASLFELTVPRADGRTKRVLVRTAERSATNSRTVTITVNELVPEGSKLTLQRKAFDRKASGTIEIEVESDLDAALVLLASTAMVVTRESFYQDPATAPVIEADRDPAAMRSLLEEHVLLRGSGAEVAREALATYDAIPVEIIPSPKLRAALAALTGTFAQPAITSILTSDNCTNRPAASVLFQLPPQNPDLIARVTYTRGGARVISVNPFAEGERIEHLMPILAHEAIHCDQKDGIFEEVAATAFDGFLYLQLVAADAQLAAANTRVARELNIDAVALINSGQRYPESIGILQSPGVTAVLPLTNSQARSFAELVAFAYKTITETTSPSESVAQAYASILAEFAGMELGEAFDVRYLDELISRAVDPGVLAAAIEAFQLTPAS